MVGLGVQVAGSIPGAVLFAEVLGKQYSRSDCEQSKHARKKIGAWKIDFLQSLRFLQAIEENNVSGPQVYTQIDFCVDCEQPKHARKINFSELEKLIFCKASVVFKLLRKTMFQVPRPIHIWILGGTEAVQTCAKKQFFGAWKIVFLQSPISSRKTI